MPSSTSTVAPPHPPKPLSRDVAFEWALDDSIAFLNHGCFGARPRVVVEAQARLREAYESRPIEFLDRKRAALIADARDAVGAAFGARAANLGFVTNATGGVCAVLRSLTFNPGDELVTTNHVYNAVRLSMRHLAERAGARYIEIDLPLPLHSPDDVVRAVEGAITSRTRLVVIDHVTSPTAVLFPVERIIELCEKRGIDVLVDGAHAPGMVALDIETLGAAYYAGNLHKWVCAPSGAGFLWVRPDKQRGVHPLTISHFLDEAFAREFEWQGTRDITPWLCVKDAIAYFKRYGWERVMRHNHEMATWVQWMLTQRWSVEPSTPVDGSMVGSMVTVRLPNQETIIRRYGMPEKLQARLYDEYGIEVPVIPWREQWWVRPCCQVYNTAEQYERLGDAVLNSAGA